jgi:hypothetical protein
MNYQLGVITVYWRRLECALILKFLFINVIYASSSSNEVKDSESTNEFALRNIKVYITNDSGNVLFSCLKMKKSSLDIVSLEKYISALSRNTINYFKNNRGEISGSIISLSGVLLSQCEPMRAYGLVMINDDAISLQASDSLLSASFIFCTQRLRILYAGES